MSLTPDMSLRLRKNEKLCSTTAINSLFAADGTSAALAFPLRMVSRRREEADGDAAAVRFFISVPKKKLRRAVDRVTMRRRIREAYRLNRHLLPEGIRADVAFIYVAPDLRSFARVQTAMQRLLPQLSPTPTSSATASASSDEPARPAAPAQPAAQ